MGMKIFVVMDSTDSWSGETSLYRAFRTEEAARRFLSEVMKVPLDIYDRKDDDLSQEEVNLLLTVTAAIVCTSILPIITLI